MTRLGLKYFFRNKIYFIHEYVVHTFILSRGTYVNKVIFCGFLFSFIYTCTNTLKLFGNVWQTRIHVTKFILAPEHDLVF
jgi:hypothetical protein